MIGGLGGFVLPIVFGALLDLTGLWTSCFMLLFVLVAGALPWMHFAIRADGARLAGERSTSCPNPGDAGDPQARAVGALPARGSRRLAPGGPFWEHGAPDRAAQPVDFDPGLLLSFAVWHGMVGGRGQAAAVGFNFTTDQLFWLAALPGISGATLRIFYSFMVPIFGGRLWTTLSTGRCSSRRSASAMRCRTRHALLLLPGAGAALRLRRRQLRLVHGQHRLLLPEGGEGQGAGLNAGLGNLGVSVVQFLIPLVDHRRRLRRARRRPAWVRRPRRRSGCRMPASSGCRSSCSRHCGLVRHERHRRGQGLLRRAGGDLPAKAQLDHVPALHWDLRLLHRLSPPGFPLLAKTCSRRSIRCSSSSSGRWSARCRAWTGWVADKYGGGARDLLGLRR